MSRTTPGSSRTRQGEAAARALAAPGQQRSCRRHACRARGLRFQAARGHQGRLREPGQPANTRASAGGPTGRESAGKPPSRWAPSPAPPPPWANACVRGAPLGGPRGLPPPPPPREGGAARGGRHSPAGPPGVSPSWSSQPPPSGALPTGVSPLTAPPASSVQTP